MIYAACRLIDIPEFRRLARFRKTELGLAIATTAGVLLVDILYGVLIAVALSVLDLFRRVARPHDRSARNGARASRPPRCPRTTPMR